MSLPRYPEYRDSGVEWLGEIPEHWETARIRRLTGLGMGQTILREMLEEGPSSDALPVYSASEGEAPFGYFKNPAVRLSKGDLIIGARGSIGMARVVTQESTCTQTTIWVKVATPSLVPEFAYWSFVGGREGLFPFDKTAIPMLTVEQVASGAVPLPPIHEQVEIASFLGRETAKIDALIAEQEKLLALLAEKREATISHAVTRGLDPNAPLKDSGIPWLGQVPAHWEVVPFKYCVHFQEGPGIMADDFRDEGVPLLRVSGVRTHWATLEGCNYLDPEKVQARWSHFKVEEGDLLISASASMGTVCEVGPEAAGSVPYTGIIRLKAIDGMMVKNFVRHVVVSGLFLTQIDLLKAGATIQHFGPTHLSQMDVARPPEREQQEIAACLDAALADLAELQREAGAAIELLWERRSALVSAAVTGQVDVRGFVETQAA